MRHEGPRHSDRHDGQPDREIVVHGTERFQFDWCDFSHRDGLVLVLLEENGADDVGGRLIAAWTRSGLPLAEFQRRWHSEWSVSVLSGRKR